MTQDPKLSEEEKKRKETLDKLSAQVAEAKEHEDKSKQIEEFEKLNRSVNTGNGKGEKKTKKKLFVQKHSSNKLLAETVIIDGKTKFAVSRLDNKNEVRIILEDSIEYENEIVIPLENSMSRTFTFKSGEEFNQFIEKSKLENLDSLYRKVKAIWLKYIDADDFHISLCAADTIFTYFQDKIGLTHYLFFVGGNDTGKSNNLTVIEFLAYRCFNSISITYANIYTFLGSGEEGQGTICEDEADNIDRDHEKMKIYKSGYQTGKGVARTDLPQGVRSQNKWRTFGFKAFAGERLPDIMKGKGLLQRITELNCSDGNPQYDIAEVVSAEHEEEFQGLLDELDETHNLLLAYKLLNFHKAIPNIKLNIRNREKQLFKPILRVFQNTETFSELLLIVSHFVNQRRENNANSFHTFLYGIIRDSIKEKDSYQVASNYIWEKVKSALSGEEIPKKPLSYDSSDFGVISQKEVVETLVQVFNAKRPKHHGSERELIFDKEKFARLARKYDVSTEVKVTDGTDGTDGTDVGLDAHLPKDDSDKEITENRPENTDNFYNNDDSNEETILQDQQERPTHPINASQASQASHEEADSNNNNSSYTSYRSYHSSDD
ncbi:MAG: hypothetical protein WAL24_09595 [Nitrososphaeraceae archaeon]